MLPTDLYRGLVSERRERTNVTASLGLLDGAAGEGFCGPGVKPWEGVK